MQGLEQTEPCPPPPASQTTSSLPSVCCDAKGLGHRAFLFLQTPSPHLLPLSSPMFLLVFLSCAIPAAVPFFCYCRDQWGSYGPSNRMDSHNVSDSMLRTSMPAALKDLKCPSLNRKTCSTKDGENTSVATVPRKMPF